MADLLSTITGAQAVVRSVTGALNTVTGAGGSNGGAAPRSQKAEQRPISFRMKSLAGKVYNVPLVIRPEELVYGRPRLQTVTRTLNGAFLDDFGRGIDTVTIHGHTGWGGGGRPDGGQQFELLSSVLNQWDADRRKLQVQGRDPSQVKLFFVDDLDGIAAIVAPGHFALRRSRSRPLLYMYDLPMTVLSYDLQDAPADSYQPGKPGSGPTVLAGIQSLASSITKLTTAAGDVRSFIDSTMALPMGSLLTVSTGAFQNVSTALGLSNGVVTSQVAQLTGLAGDLARAGRNAFSTYAAITSQDQFSAAQTAGVASELNNVHCLMNNAFRPVLDYPDYSGVYGSSNCSSTTGGAPLSQLDGTNPFETLVNVPDSTSAVTPDARSQIEALVRTDPVLAPMSSSQLKAAVARVVAGVTV